jgi:hypothetical protein
MLMNAIGTPTGPDPDRAAAHDFLAELRTRITTQTLPYQYGVEARALESLWEVFDQARATMKKYPGCSKFAAAVIHMLNVEVRPVTAKWHRALVEGRCAAQATRSTRTCCAGSPTRLFCQVPLRAVSGR